MNSYTHVRVSEDWEAAVPAEVVQVREQMLPEEPMARFWWVARGIWAWRGLIGAGLAMWGGRTQGWCCWGQGGCSIARQVDSWSCLCSPGDIFSFACLCSFLLSAEIPVFLPVAFLPGAQTSLLAAPGSLHSQDPPGGPSVSGAVPATSTKCPAPVPAARLRGHSLLGVAAPVLLCLSGQRFHPCQCSLCFP